MQVPSIVNKISRESLRDEEIRSMRLLPYKRLCAICRRSFRSRKFNHYCADCSKAREQLVEELYSILDQQPLTRAAVEIQEKPTCGALEDDGNPCDWNGGPLRRWPTTVAGWHEAIPRYVMTLMRHEWKHLHRVLATERGPTYRKDLAELEICSVCERVLGWDVPLFSDSCDRSLTHLSCAPGAIRAILNGTFKSEDWPYPKLPRIEIGRWIKTQCQCGFVPANLTDHRQHQRKMHGSIF